MLRTAAVLCWVLAAGFGLPGFPAIASVARGDGVWTLFGYPTYGHGPFERMGVPTTVPLLVAFLLVAAAEVGVGVLLWTRRRAAPVAALVLLPVEMLFWIGFALPYGPVLGLLRTVLVVLGRREAAGATDAVSTPGSDESERT
jgi:hypothetical protein